MKKDPSTDPFSLLKEKLLNEKFKDSKLSFRLKTVSEKQVMKILKSLKPKKSYGCDGITSELIKLGAACFKTDYLSIKEAYLGL